MAPPDSTTIPDYGSSTREVYFKVMRKVRDDRPRFGNLLSQIMGIAGKDVDFWDQALYVIRIINAI
jgi:hypothetical protein